MKVLVTSPLPVNAALELEKAGIETQTGSGKMSKREIMESAKSVDGIISLLSDSIDAEVIDSAPNLKVVANYAVGFDNIDVKHAASKGIYVTNTPDVLTDATADLAFSLLLSCARRIPEADRYVREGNFKGWRPDEMLGSDVAGKTLGIFGFGRIGRAVAKRASGFSMRIIYTDSAGQDFPDAEQVDFETLLKVSDFISLNASLNPSNQRAFTMREFEKMKRSAILVNTARGKLINEEDLAKALENRIIKAAGLDVYEFEPEINERLKKLDNVILAPHMGSATVETRVKMAEICIKSVKDVLIKNRRPDSCVNLW